MQATKAAWTAADLTRAISDALPDHLGQLDGAQVTSLLEGLTRDALTLAVPLDADRPGDSALPDELRLANGQSAYDAPGRRLFATPQHIHTERLLSAATARTAPALTRRQAGACVDSLAKMGVELGADQAAAVRGVLSSGAGVETLVGPAGTGKSFVVGAIAKAWQDPNLWSGQPRKVVGLATSQIATEVLADEGLTARNVVRWLATQQRLADGTATADDLAWQLHAGDLVVVDESAMTATADLAAIHQHVTAAGAKLLLTGDHRQLAAVGPAGGMDLLAASNPRYELAEARRFTAAWEREASLRLREADETVLGEYHKHGRLLDGGTVEQAERSAARAWLADTLAGQHALLIVDTNEQAARLSAQLRAELVRLGCVADHGVPLGLQGTFGGGGDLIQARRNGWHLADVEGNRRGPINREMFRVVEARDDGSLVVIPVAQRVADGEGLGELMTLPADYVAEHVALGYASTVHAAQGLTVDTCHTVVTPSTGAPALYVGMSRGRHGNTAHVTTRSVPADAPTGAAHEAVHRSPAAALATTFETSDTTRSALAEAVESLREAQSVRTPAELVADASELATAGRTARWFDQLVDEGHMTAQQRAALAAEDGATSLTRVLRRAELAGHDPQLVLREAITSRPLDGARQLTNVIHHRITDAVSLDPVGDSYRDWIPRVDDPQWRHYLHQLADAADARRRDLGREVAEAEPQWAIEALGVVPADPGERQEWADRAGIVAAHRELSGQDDPATALGTPPKPGQVEAYASWRAAWRALGRPEADRDEIEMTDGQLRLRIRAHQREEAWAPRYVANELAGTTQAAAGQRTTAQLRAAEAANAADPQTRTRLEREAHEAAALAEVLEARTTELEYADQVRTQWYLHTAETRAAADRAAAELSARVAAGGQDDELIPAEEWLAEHHAAQFTDDEHRQVTDETDLADVAAQREAELSSIDRDEHAHAVHHGPDIRQTTAEEPAQIDEDIVRVPTAEETADAVARAQRALAEMERRRAEEERRAAEEARAEQLAHWHADDHAADRGQVDERASPREPELAVTTPLD
jgi:hypothetical protein